MYFDRRWLLLLLLVVLGIGLSIKWVWPTLTVDTPSTPYLGVAVIGDDQELEHLCPDGSVERVRYLPQSAVYESPVRWEATRGIRPVLLSDWYYSADARSVDLVFKKNVRYHNGKEMTALDVKACWEKTLRQAASGEVVGLFVPIAGTDTYLNGQANEIYGLQVMSPRKLRIKFTHPYSYFISSLTHPAFWVYDSQDKTEWAPGTGPFCIKEVKDTSIRVEAFNQYHGDGPEVSGINFQVFPNDQKAIVAFKEGKVNLVDEVDPGSVKQLAADATLTKQLIHQPLLAVYGLALNLDKEPWCDNYLLRRAVSYGIDRQAMVRDIFAGGALACSGPLPAGLKVGKVSERGYNYNPELAKQLLGEAGYPEGDGLSGITLYYLDNGGYRQLAVSIAEQLGALGVEVYPRELNKSSLLSELNSRRYQSCLVGWQADFPEPYAFFSTIYNNGVTGYQNRQVSGLLQEVGSVVKPNQKSQDKLANIYRLITEDAPMLWLCQPQTVKLAAPLLTGLEFNSLNQIEWSQVHYRK